MDHQDVGLDAFPDIYPALREIAARMRARAGGESFAPTSIVHEAWFRLEKSPGRWNDRAHFLAYAAKAVRHVLVDRARGLGRQKRGGDLEQVTLTGLGVSSEPVDVIALDRALDELAALEPRLATLVELRFFGGLTNEEISTRLGFSTRTVEKDWRRARAWLAVALAPATP